MQGQVFCLFRQLLNGCIAGKNGPGEGRKRADRERSTSGGWPAQGTDVEVGVCANPQRIE